jgi:hypothetical protein
MIHYLVPAAQQGGILEYLDFWGRPLVHRMRALPYEELPGLRRMEPGTYVLSALDQLGPAMTRLVAALHGRLHGEAGFRFLNHPQATLRRFDLLGELHRAGFNEFRAVRAGGDLSRLRYPVFLRVEREHDGPASPLLETPRELEAAIGRALVRGHALANLLVVEFCATADDSGRFRKYAAFVVGDRVLPRNIVWGNDWMLKHDQGEYTRASVMEELEYVRGGAPLARLAEIASLARVGYGRIDFAVKAGLVQTWEINLNPVIGRGRRPTLRVIPPDLQRVRFRSKRHFYRAFQAAWEAVDSSGGDGAARALELDPALARDALLERQGSRRPAGHLAGYLEPARPALERIAGGTLPWVARLARWRTPRG